MQDIVAQLGVAIKWNRHLTQNQLEMSRNVHLYITKSPIINVELFKHSPSCINFFLLSNTCLFSDTDGCTQIGSIWASFLL